MTVPSAALGQSLSHAHGPLWKNRITLAFRPKFQAAVNMLA